ncbi:hypothetical protein WA158_000502 [Blastocystis sp. Blastoise]
MIYTTILDRSADTFRIMISTDNHLGYKENDPVIGDDSFIAFEQVLKAAVDNKVDFMLLGGDLFDANKPSRFTMNKTIQLLNKYCLGDKPIQFQYIKTPFDSFRNDPVNYEDSNVNIQLPIFAIHGNHDDPTRDGSHGDALSALDILSSCKLINYFARAKNVEDISISPLLLEKGQSRLCIYGLGYIPDERLSRLFEQQKVTFLRPDQNPDSWFNIFVLHQNSDKGHANKCVKHSYIPSFMDLVIWGHEHEQYIEPSYSKTGNFSFIQPGSSCITSLIEGEATDKYVGILEIRGLKFKMNPIKLTSIRPLLYKYINLSEYLHVDPSVPAIKDSIETVLDSVLEGLLEESKAAVASIKKEREEEGYIDPLEEEEKENKTVFSEEEIQRRHINRQLPLIRLMVNFDPYIPISVQIYGAKYTGKVANPSTLVSICRHKERESHNSRGTNTSSEETISKPFIEDEATYNTMSSLVNKYIQTYGGLSILSSSKLDKAMSEYINKSNEIFKSVLQEPVDIAAQLCDETDLSCSTDILTTMTKQRIAEPTDITSDSLGNSQQSTSNQSVLSTKTYMSMLTYILLYFYSIVTDISDSDDDLEVTEVLPPKRSTRKRSTVKKTVKKAKKSADDDMEF